MLKEIIETYSEENNLVFIYGDKATQNLLGCIQTLNGKTGLFLEPIQRDYKFSEYGGTESETFKGHLVLIVKSNLDGGSPEIGGQDYYDEKYNNHIKPLLSIAQSLASSITCEELEVLEWSIIEVVNLFDENTDGISIRFTIKQST